MVFLGCQFWRSPFVLLSSPITTTVRNSSLQLECSYFSLNSPLFSILTYCASYLTSMQFNIIFQVSCRTRQTKLLCVFFSGSILSQCVILTIPAKDLVSWNLLRAFAKFAESDCHLHICLSIRSFAWNNWAPFGRILMKFNIWVVLENE